MRQKQTRADAARQNMIDRLLGNEPAPKPTTSKASRTDGERNARIAAGVARDLRRKGFGVYVPPRQSMADQARQRMLDRLLGEV